MTRKSLAIFAIGLVLAVGAVAVTLYAYYLGSNMAPVPNNEPIGIKLKHESDRVVLVASNTSTYPITFDIQLKGAQPLGNFPRTLGPGEHTSIFDLGSTSPDPDSLDPRLQFIPGSLEANRNAIYLLPCGCGATCTVARQQAKFFHSGWAKYAVDFEMPTGTRVYAIGSGTVIDAFDASSKNCSEPSPICDRFTNKVLVLGEDGGIVEYLHLDTRGALVDVGDYVRQGQAIALSGNTGNSSGPHLHVDLFKALPDLTQATVPITFETDDGPKVLEQGQSYRSSACSSSD